MTFNPLEDAFRVIFGPPIWELSSDDYPKFTVDPCPVCQADGDDSGYIVNPNCEQCLGSGRLREENERS